MGSTFLAYFIRHSCSCSRWGFILDSPGSWHTRIQWVHRPLAWHRIAYCSILFNSCSNLLRSSSLETGLGLVFFVSARWLPWSSPDESLGNSSRCSGGELALDVVLRGRGSRRLTCMVKVLRIFFIVFCVTMPFFSGYLSTFLGEYAIFFDKPKFRKDECH